MYPEPRLVLLMSYQENIMWILVPGRKGIERLEANGKESACIWSSMRIGIGYRESRYCGCEAGKSLFVVRGLVSDQGRDIVAGGSGDLGITRGVGEEC